MHSASSNGLTSLWCIHRVIQHMRNIQSNGGINWRNQKHRSEGERKVDKKESTVHGIKDQTILLIESSVIENV